MILAIVMVLGLVMVPGVLTVTTAVPVKGDISGAFQMEGHRGLLLHPLQQELIFNLRFLKGRPSGRPFLFRGCTPEKNECPQ